MAAIRKVHLERRTRVVKTEAHPSDGSEGLGMLAYRVISLLPVRDSRSHISLITRRAYHTVPPFS